MHLSYATSTNLRLLRHSLKGELSGKDLTGKDILFHFIYLILNGTAAEIIRK